MPADRLTDREVASCVQDALRTDAKGQHRARRAALEMLRNGLGERWARVDIEDLWVVVASAAGQPIDPTAGQEQNNQEGTDGR